MYVCLNNSCKSFSPVTNIQFSAYINYDCSILENGMFQMVAKKKNDHTFSVIYYVYEYVYVWLR